MTDKSTEKNFQLKSWAEWEKERKEWQEHHFILYFLSDKIYYPLIRFKNRIFQIPSEIKYFIQRGKRGWADRDVWCLHAFHSEIMVGTLKKLKQDKHGIPSNILSPSHGESWNETEEKEAIEKWNSYLDAMIWTFEMFEKIENGQAEEYTKWSWKKENEQWRRNVEQDFKTHFITSEEHKKMKYGFDLFFKYYLSLWD